MTRDDVITEDDEEIIAWVEELDEDQVIEIVRELGGLDGYEDSAVRAALAERLAALEEELSLIHI